MALNRASQIEIPTFGVLFPDGTAIDRLRGGSLIIGHQGEELAGPVVEYGGQLYKGAPVDPSLEGCFPSRAEDFGCVADLVADVEAKIAQLVAVDEVAALLLASFVASTWVCDRLPTIPVLNVWGAAGEETRLVNVLASLCRRSLVLAGPSLSELLRLPADFAPTLFVRPKNRQSAAPWLSAVTSCDARTLRKGSLVGLRCPVAIFTSEPFEGVGLSVALPPDVLWRRLSAHEQEAVERLQERLVSFRLQRHLQVTASSFDVEEFVLETRLIAASLGAALEGAPALQDRLIEALKSADEQGGAERCQQPAGVVLDALLATCHERSKRISVGELADRVNTILTGRQDERRFSPRAVGEIVRRLGLKKKRTAGGVELNLDHNTRSVIHRLSRRFGVKRLQSLIECEFCDADSPKPGVLNESAGNDE